jgi:hypothetical protein
MNITIALCIAALSIFTASAVAAEGSPKTGKLQHVVALKFKEGTTREQIKTVEDAFRGLKKKIPQIAALEWGTNNSPEKLDKGFTHCFILTFKTEKDREIYLPHPDHKAFVNVLLPVLEEVFVIDFWAQN